jgi:excisionase family DNA binding protein
VTAPTIEQATAQLAEAIRAELDRPRAPRLLSVPEACEFLGISRATAYNLMRSGALRATKVGTRTLIPETELARLAQP